ncbi:flagellar assembly protein FliH [Collimonas sp. OK607]|uniref:flagellar assembly protein FliH n=1 Tax=Collimonas sp. OK607 TaxID=1798194 RepID=UPI0008E07A6A|nr:flagellar assembly protein FliH [Collimonas sp. OK607]SFB22376.1 flagellar assembly protein FliH [Collimonas sp. OK607]
MSDLDQGYGKLSSRRKTPAAANPAHLPKPPMSAWQRWEMGDVQQPADRSAAETSAPALAAEPMLAVLEPKLLIDEAELQRLRQDAQQAGASEGRQQGHAEGWQEGYAAGLEIARNEAEGLRALSLAMPGALRLAEKELADDLLTLALDIARQVVRQALTVEPQLILAAVRELLQTEPALSGTPRLLMHADDMALVQQYLAEDLQAAGWLLRSDPTITRGGCRVQASSGELDATMETRWQRVAAALGRSQASVTIASHD